jgi:hypothetical protein
MAYKPIDEIIAQIEPTAGIVARIKPLYNFKASEQERRRRQIMDKFVPYEKLSKK